MKRENIIILIIMICMFIILPAIIFIDIIYVNINYKIYYTYVDLDNNEGIAYECKYTDKSYKSGGMGTPVCELKDGTILSVKSYKHHKEKKNGEDNE